MAGAEPEKKPGPAQGSFTIENFKLESGAVLPKAIVVYGTYGHLNAAHDNAVLLPSHYMATHHGYEWLIGPGRALDTAKLFPRRDGIVRQRPLVVARATRRSRSMVRAFR